MTRLRPQRTMRGLSVVIAAALLVVACSNGSEFDEASSDREPIDIITATLSAPRSAPLGNSDFLPALLSDTHQARWIEVADQLCVRSLAVDEPDSICASIDPDTTIDLASLTWSADGSTLFFNEHWAKLRLEPDVWSFTPATGELVNLTDDGTSAINDADARLDNLGFTSDKGVVHHFQFLDDATLLWALDPDGAVRQLSVDLPPGRPMSSPHRVGPDQFLVRYFNSESPNQSLMLLDLADLTIREVPLPGIISPLVVASGPNAAIVTDLIDWAGGRSHFVYVRLDPTEPGSETVVAAEQIDLDLVPEFGPNFGPFLGHPSFAVSPTGNSFVVSRRADKDRDHELLAFYWQPSGNLSEPAVIAPAGFLGTDESGQARGVNSSPTFQSMVWTHDDQLLMLSASDAVVFQLVDPATD